jgi:uncharacterized SAM-binding protein YcdF (DUF218 family)
VPAELKPGRAIVLFGATVRPDGTPSGALLRRVAGVDALAKQFPAALILLSGGSPDRRPTEADVMRQQLLSRGIDASRLIMENIALSTRDSAARCAALLRAHGIGGPVLVCTDTYHQLRCAALLRLHGFDAVRPPMPSGRTANGALRWAWYYLRDYLLALPKDVALTFLVSRRRR